MSNTDSYFQFAIFQGQQVMIIEHFAKTAWVAFDDGDEQEVSMFELEMI